MRFLLIEASLNVATFRLPFVLVRILSSMLERIPTSNNRYLKVVTFSDALFSKKCIYVYGHMQPRWTDHPSACSMRKF